MRLHLVIVRDFQPRMWRILSASRPGVATGNPGNNGSAGPATATERQSDDGGIASQSISWKSAVPAKDSMTVTLPTACRCGTPEPT